MASVPRLACRRLLAAYQARHQGSFYHVSKQYLSLYLSEFSFRHNNRKNPDMFETVIAAS